MPSLFDTAATAAPLASPSSAQDLLTVLRTVQERIRGIGGVWVKAEISAVSEKSGHWYIDFIQKETGPFNSGSVVAKVRGTIWRGRAALVAAFEKETGVKLAAGVTIVFHATPSFSPVFGTSLDIDDIDASFTLGERERQRRETLKYLSDNGLLALQGKLPLPYLPDRIAVITSATAAGYGDFMKHIKDNPRGFVIPTRIFPATMQGESAPRTIIDAIAAAESWADIILVMRGGGAESDMYCFDDRALCEAVCRTRTPVLSAVGHEKDHHIIDDAACRSFKTPTALADHIIQWFSGVEDAMVSVKDAIAKAVAARTESGTRDVMTYLSSIRGSLARAITSLENLASGPHRAIVLSLADRKNRMQAEIKHLLLSAGAAVTNVAVSSAATVTSLRQGIIRGTDMRLHILDAETGRLAGNVAFMSKMRLGSADASIREQLLLIEAADPRKVLSQGYVLAVDEKGNVLKGSSARAAGDKFILRHLDGRWDCTVDKVTSESE